jgi:uncharacterized membrane protein
MVFIHPIIVHFVIAFLSAAVILDLLYLAAKKEQFWQISNYLMLIGTFSSIVAVVSGHQAEEAIIKTSEVNDLIVNHQISGELTMWLFISLTTFRYIFRKFNFFEKATKWIYYILGIISLVFLFRTGLLGGEMVYIHGIGTPNTKKPPVEKPTFKE